jgi:gamma-glutamyl-gamma-aminobutyrate hydrolase PuuD
MSLIKKKPSEITIAVVGTDSAVREIFSKRGYIVKSSLLTTKSSDYDAIVFTGGGDISPYLYGQGKHPSTTPDYSRDLRELAVLRRVPRLKPKIGICRGGQLLNVYSGGSMYQDVDNHRGSHKATCCISGKDLTVSSAHHQAMITTSDALILMTSSVSTKRTSYEKTEFINTKAEDHDIEACYYEHTQSYCFQGHPEYEKESEEYFFNHLNFCFSDVWSYENEEKTEQEVMVG